MLTPEERRQRELVDGLRTDIRALAHSLDVYAQALKATETSRDASYQQAEEARIRAVVLEQIQTERNATEAKSKKKEWSSFEKGYLTVQILLLVATAGAFGAAYWYARIADVQKNTMISQGQTMDNTLAETQKQTPIINRSADAADRAITQNTQAFKIDERARIKLTIGEHGWSRDEGHPLVANYSYSNIGKTEAEIIGMDRHVLLIPHTPGRPLNTDSMRFPATAPIGPGRQVIIIPPAGTTPEYRITAFNHNFPETMSPTIDRGEQLFASYGCIEYRDIFGDIHYTDFCNVRQPPPNQNLYGTCTYQCKREDKKPK